MSFDEGYIHIVSTLIFCTSLAASAQTRAVLQDKQLTANAVLPCNGSRKASRQ